MREFANKWIVAGFIALQLFNVIAITGAVDKANGVFLPLGLLAADNVASWEKGMMDKVAGDKNAASECNTAFDNYFKLESIETSREGADPQVKYFGFCTDAFVGTVAVFVMAMGMIQFIMTVLSFGLMIPRLGGSLGSGLIPESK